MCDADHGQTKQIEMYFRENQHADVNSRMLLLGEQTVIYTKLT